MGEAALEQTELSPAQAARVFTVMSTLTFTDTTGAQSPVPYHYAVDGCYARAQMMAQMLTRAGIASERVFATRRCRAGCTSRTCSPRISRGRAAGDDLVMPRGPDRPREDRRRRDEETVIDPSTQSGPVPIATWLAAMGVAPGTYSRKTHAELMAHLAAPRPGPDDGRLPRRGADRLHDRSQHDVPRGRAERDSANADAELEGLNPR